MHVDEETIRDLCTDAVFERGQTYREGGRIQQLDRFDTTVTATVKGSHVYDLTVEVDGPNVESHCTCPYDGPGDCKHVVAVLLDVAADPPVDERGQVEPVLETVSTDDLRAFVSKALTRDPELRDRFLARFGETTVPSVDEYRTEVDQLFDQHADDYAVVVEAIDFSRFFDMAAQYRDRDRYRGAATIYRALFEGIDDNIGLVDAAYDHYATTFQSALEGYVECVLAADPAPEEFETDAGVLAERVSTGAPVHQNQFRKGLDDLEEGR